MGPVISPQILQGINNVPASNLAELLNDQKTQQEKDPTP